MMIKLPVFFLLFAKESISFVISSYHTKGLSKLFAFAADDQKVAKIDSLLDRMSTSNAGRVWAEMFGFSDSEMAFYSLFEGMRNEIPIGLRGKPFLLKGEDSKRAVGVSFADFFTFKDLEKAVNDDFLDAGRGTTDNRKGWKMAAVSAPKGQSFEEARLNFHEVQAALLKGTVIFNSAGAHIPKLAGPSLACTDALSLPNALNMYVTAPGMRTSAPPHTDKQDVIVVQTSGKKHWRVYSPPNPAQKPLSDMFSRGKGDDNLPLYSIQSDFGCELLLEATLNPGDVLYVPAAFPHTTDTSNVDNDETSIHLTFGIDTHIWGLDYLSLRKWALKRCQVPDAKLGRKDNEDNHYTGPVNELPYDQILDLMDALPLGFLDDGAGENEVDTVCSKLEKISEAVDEISYSNVPKDIWKETALKVQEYGKELLDIHRDMYLAAVEEGRNREAEDAIMSHLSYHNRKGLTPDQMQRLSVFRVKRFFEKIETSTKELSDWSSSGKAAEAIADEENGLPENWAFTLPVKVGDIVDADLGGAFFPATITRASGGSYDVLYFDGDKDHNLDRNRIKLLKPPIVEDDVDTSSMTPKQLKRWKKEQQQKNVMH